MTAADRKIVGECWTCLDYPEGIPIQAADVFSGKGLRPLQLSSGILVVHRAAGHDVRPVQVADKVTP